MHLSRLSDIMDHGGGSTDRVEGITTVLNIVFLAVAALLVVRFLGLGQALSVGANDACRH
jgi:hypothetical protein